MLCINIYLKQPFCIGERSLLITVEGDWWCCYAEQRSLIDTVKYTGACALAAGGLNMHVLNRCLVTSPTALALRTHTLCTSSLHEYHKRSLCTVPFMLNEQSPHIRCYSCPLCFRTNIM